METPGETPDMMDITICPLPVTASVGEATAACSDSVPINGETFLDRMPYDVLLIILKHVDKKGRIPAQWAMVCKRWNDFIHFNPKKPKILHPDGTILSLPSGFSLHWDDAFNTIEMCELFRVPYLKTEVKQSIFYEAANISQDPYRRLLDKITRKALKRGNEEVLSRAIQANNKFNPGSSIITLGETVAGCGRIDLIKTQLDKLQVSYDHDEISVTRPLEDDAIVEFIVSVAKGSAYSGNIDILLLIQDIMAHDAREWTSLKFTDKVRFDPDNFSAAIFRKPNRVEYASLFDSIFGRFDYSLHAAVRSGCIMNVLWVHSKMIEMRESDETIKDVAEYALRYAVAKKYFDAEVLSFLMSQTDNFPDDLDVCDEALNVMLVHSKRDLVNWRSYLSKTSIAVTRRILAEPGLITVYDCARACLYMIQSDRAKLVGSWSAPKFLLFLAKIKELGYFDAEALLKLLELASISGIIAQMALAIYENWDGGLPSFDELYHVFHFSPLGFIFMQTKLPGLRQDPLPFYIELERRAMSRAAKSRSFYINLIIHPYAGHDCMKITADQYNANKDMLVFRTKGFKKKFVL